MIITHPRLQRNDWTTEAIKLPFKCSNINEVLQYKTFIYLSIDDMQINPSTVQKLGVYKNHFANIN